MSFDELKANAEYELMQEQRYCDEVLGWYEHQQERADYFYEGETYEY